MGEREEKHKAREHIWEFLEEGKRKGCGFFLFLLFLSVEKREAEEEHSIGRQEKRVVLSC